MQLFQNRNIEYTSRFDETEIPIVFSRKSEPKKSSKTPPKTGPDFTKIFECIAFYKTPKK